jgi:phosphatidylinositol 3-kinase
LDLSDEEAILYFQALINESVGALFPQLMETVHKWAQYWRK